MALRRKNSSLSPAYAQNIPAIGSQSSKELIFEVDKKAKSMYDLRNKKELSFTL